MHILFLCHYFPPEVNAPATRTYENAKRWVMQGNQVTVITCQPSHPDGIIYPGYKNTFYQWDSIDGINILRVGTYISANKGFLKRTLNYLSYMFSAILHSLRVYNVDLVVSTSPQFFCGLAGYFVAKIKRKRWVLEIRDLWPDSIIAVGAISNSLILLFLRKIESFLYRHADHIISLTYSFQKHIENCGGKSNKISVITNGVDIVFYTPQDRENYIRKKLKLKDDVLLVSYIGTHGMAHGLNTILKVAKRLQDNPKIHFLLVGDGAKRKELIEEKNRLDLKNLTMDKQKSKNEVPYYIAASDICLVLLIKSNIFETVLPSKIFEIMAMARPVILGVEGESKLLVEAANSGICIEPENVTELYKGILKLYENKDLRDRLGKNARKYVQKKFDRKILADQYLDILNKIS